MAVPPFDGLPGDGDEPADETALERDDAIEGTVVPFPGSPPPPAPRKVRFGEAAELRPILPAHLRTWAAARKHYGWHLKRGRHHFLYHLVRVPKRARDTLRWATLGVLKIGWLQVNWWWLTEQTYLRMQAVASNDPRTWESLHKHAVKRRAFRGGVLAAELAALLVLAGTVTAYAPLGWVPIALVVLPLLAWFGHPDDKPILTSATVPVAYETLTFEVVVRVCRSRSSSGRSSSARFPAWVRRSSCGCCCSSARSTCALRYTPTTSRERATSSRLARSRTDTGPVTSPKTSST